MRRLIKAAVIAILILTAGIFVKGSITQPSIGAWLSAGAMTEARSSAASALLQDGRILITGGDNGSGPRATAEFFNTTGSFVAAPPMSTPRSAHSATVLADGRVLVAGGWIGAAATNAAEIFDPAANAWTQVAGGMIQARSNHTASLLADGRVLFAGGDNAGTPTASLEIFDPVANSFSSVGVMTSTRTSFASAILSDGRVMLIGGSNGSAPLASTEIFDPPTNSVGAGPALSAPRMAHSATTLLDGRVLVAGGTTVVTNPDGSTSNTDLASAEIYDPSTGSFSVSSSSLAVPRRDHAAFLLPNNNSVLIVGGTSSSNEVATAEMYIPSTGTFAPTGSPAAARQHATGNALKQDGILFLAGGSNSTGTLSSAELYGFATVKTDKADYAPGTVVTITGSGWQPGETVTLTLVESPLIDTHPVMTAIADSMGKIVNTDFSPDAHDISIRFYLTAVGSISGIHAQNTFTDALQTTTTLASNPNPSNLGQGVTFTATVTATSTPTGNVKFYDQTGVSNGNCNNNLGTQIGTTQSLNNSGQAAVTTSSLPSGNRSIRACYLGTGGGPNGFQTSEAALTQTVNSTVATTTTVATSITPSTYGQSVTFTAVVSPNTGSTTPTGSVQFVIDGSNSGLPVALSGGTASIVTSSLPVSGSPHTVVANYMHTGIFTDSNGALLGGQTINPKPVTASIVASDKDYDGNNTASITSCTIPGKVGSDDVACTASGAVFASANASASAQTVTATVALSGAAAGNYTLGANTTATTTAKINPKPVTASIVASDKDYDGNNTASITNCTIPGKVGSDDVACTASGAVFASANASASAQTVTATVALSGAAAGNYTLGANTTATTTAKINPKPVTASITASDKDYDGNNTASITNCTIPGKVGSDDVACTASGAVFASANASASAQTVTATVALSGAAAGNYTLGANTTATTTAKINPKPVTASIVASDKDYDGNNTASITNCTLNGKVGLDDVSCVASNAVFASANASASAQTVTATVALSGAAAGNYTLGANTTATTTAKINPKPVTASITASDKDYDGNNTASITNCTIPGKVGSDDVACTASGAVFASANASASAQTVTATVALSGAAAGNYTLGANTTATTTAKINPKPVTASITASDKDYDGNNTASITNCTLNGKVGLDDVSCVASNAVFASANASASAQTVTSTVALSGAAAGNYTLGANTTATTTAKINPKPVTASITASDKDYDGNNTASITNCTLNGKVGLDDVSCVASNAVFASANASASAQTVTSTVALSGAAAGNYTLGANTTATTTAKINPKPVTASIVASDKDYDGNNTASITNCTLNGKVGLDDVSCVASNAVFASANASASAQTVTSTVALSGAAAGNYTLGANTTATTTAKINPKPVTPAITADGKDYDGTVAAIVHCTVSGVLTGDTMNVSCSGTGSFADANAETGKTVTSSDLALSGSASGNYVLSTTTATTTATINKVNQTITWADPTGIVYGTTLSATQLNATVAGVPGGSAPGTLSYMPGIGMLLNAGAGQALRVDAASTTNYNPATLTVHINVLKATPTVNWSNPADIVYGTVLSGTQLNATFTWLVGASTVSVAGVANYTPPVGTLLGAGPTQALSVSFAPTDTTNYNTASTTVHISVQKATPIVTWSNPADIAYGTPLSGAQLNATFSWVVNGSPVTVAGTATYTPATGTVLSPGANQVLTVNFTPADTTDYNNAGPKTVAINVGYGMCSASVGAGGVILPPINSDGSSVYNRKGGSTIPVKFRVCNASGASISNPALVFAGTGGTLTMLSAVRGTIDNVNETTGTDIPDVAFRWDGQQWIFNMATNNLTSGSTYAFRINLAYAPASITFVVGVK